jgi:hypothetical protein
MTNEHIESANVGNESNRLMIGDDEQDSDNKSADENYDDEEMPEDTDYQRRVQ